METRTLATNTGDAHRELTEFFLTQLSPLVVSCVRTQVAHMGWQEYEREELIQSVLFKLWEIRERLAERPPLFLKEYVAVLVRHTV